MLLSTYRNKGSQEQETAQQNSELVASHLHLFQIKPHGLRNRMKVAFCIATEPPTKLYIGVFSLYRVLSLCIRRNIDLTMINTTDVGVSQLIHMCFLCSEYMYVYIPLC